MLQMSCPNCKAVIKSHFLTDVTSLKCGLCKEVIPVKDVFITAADFTIQRKDFINRTFRFQKLLREVQKERRLMAEDNEASPESVESLDQFCSSLQELLAGARNSYRLEIPCDLYVEVYDQGRRSQGKLINLSTEGGSIELSWLDKFPRKKTELKLTFSFPDMSVDSGTCAKVVWSREQLKEDGTRSAIIGVAFTDVDETTRNCIWNYILDHAPVPFQRASR